MLDHLMAHVDEDAMAEIWRETDRPRVVALILAAGRSTRFGSDKRQARLPDGRTLLEAVVATHREVFDDVWVLTRQPHVPHPINAGDDTGDAFVQAVCAAQGARRVLCHDAALGLGHTLAHGLQLLTSWRIARLGDHACAAAGTDMVTPADTVQADAALVSMADMPWVQADTLRRLLERFVDTGRVVLPRCGDALGHPRLLPRAVWPPLLGEHGLGLQGDRGACNLLDWHAAEHVPVGDIGVLCDVDTPADIPWP